MEIADHVGGAPAGLGQGQHPGFLFFRLGLGRTGQGGEILAHQGLHRLGKGKALDFDKIVQGRLAADPTGKPIPFPVADFQAVMLTGAVGVAADVYQFMGVEPLEVGQQVKLLCLGDLFRRDIAHLPSLPLARRPKPVSLPVVQRGSQFLDCHGVSTPFSDSNSRQIYSKNLSAMYNYCHSVLFLRRLSVSKGGEFGLNAGRFTHVFLLF